MFEELADEIYSPKKKGKVKFRLNTSLKIDENKIYNFQGSGRSYKTKAGRGSKRPTPKLSDNKKARAFNYDSYKSFKKSDTYKRLKQVVNKNSEVVVKVTGYSKGRQSVINNLQYISRNGKVPLITNNGELIEDKDDIRSFTNQFANSSIMGKKRQNARDTAHFSLSFPEASKEDLHTAVEGFAMKNFPNREYVMAYHEEEEGKPHIHLIVQMRDKELKNTLRINQKEIDEYRQDFSNHINNLNYESSASRRITRGEIKKPKKQIEYHKEKNIIQGKQYQAVKEMIKSPDYSNEDLENIRAIYKDTLNNWRTLADELLPYEPEFSEKIYDFVENADLESRQEALQREVYEKFGVEEINVNELSDKQVNEIDEPIEKQQKEEFEQEF